MGRTAEVLVVGQGKGAAAVCGEQPYDGFGNSPDGATRECPVSEITMLPFSEALVKPPAGVCCCTTRPLSNGVAVVTGSLSTINQLSGIHNVKNEIQAVGYSAEREGKAHGAAAGCGVGNRVS